MTYCDCKLKEKQHSNEARLQHLIYISHKRIIYSAESCHSIPADSSCPCQSPWRPYRYGQVELPWLLRHHPLGTPPQMEMGCTCL